MQGLISSVGSLETGSSGGDSNVFHRKILTGTTSWTTDETISAKIYVIGAGGGGGGSKSGDYSGGGGASGAIRVYTGTLNAGTVIEASCGSSGQGGYSGTTTSLISDGRNGGSTNMKIKYNGSVLQDITSAGGGGGGKGYSSVGAGGKVNLSFYLYSYGMSGEVGNTLKIPSCGGMTPFAPYGCGGRSGYWDVSSIDHSGGTGGAGAVIIEWYS